MKIWVVDDIHVYVGERITIIHISDLIFCIIEDRIS